MATEHKAASRRTASGRRLRGRMVGIAVKVTAGGLICGLAMCLPVGSAQAVPSHTAHPVIIVK